MFDSGERGEYKDLMAPVVQPKPKTSGPKSKTVSLRLDDDLVERLDKVAKETGNSRNETAAQLLRFALTAHEKKPH